MMQQICKTIHIKAPASVVWEALTTPALMQQWMAEPEMGVEVITNWQIGTPIVIKGFHHLPFENKGTILQWEPNKVLGYNYLSSLSQLCDKPEHYSVIEFRLTALSSQTLLLLSISNFPTEAIYRHIDFYWRGTMEILKKFIEK